MTVQKDVCVASPEEVLVRRRGKLTCEPVGNRASDIVIISVAIHVFLAWTVYSIRGKCRTYPGAKEKCQHTKGAARELYAD